GRADCPDCRRRPQGIRGALRPLPPPPGALSDPAHEAIRRGGRGHQRHLLHSVAQGGRLQRGLTALHLDPWHCLPKSEKRVPVLISDPRGGEPGSSTSTTYQRGVTEDRGTARLARACTRTTAGRATAGGGTL